MTIGPAASPRPGHALLRQFALLSLVVIGGITGALALTVATVLRQDLLDREWSLTADYVRTHILALLRPGDLTPPGPPAVRARLEEFGQRVLSLPEVVRVTIHGADGAVVWAEDAAAIGRHAPEDPRLTDALAGRTVVNMEPPPKAAPGSASPFARVVDVYVPIVFPSASRVAGAVVARKNPQQVFASIQHGQGVAVGTVGACGLVLYLALFGIVRRAALRLDEQHQRLEARSRELVQANQELTAVQGQLVQAERLAAIGEVVTAIAHGIRNPLANIRASAQVAGLGGGAAPPTRHLATIMAEVDRLEGRLKALLQFVRPVARTATPADLSAVARAAVQMIAGRLASGRIQLIEDLPAGLPPVRGNVLLLEEVALSLLANAVEALPDGQGTVSIVTGKAMTEGGTPAVYLEVQDTGGGIHSEAFPKLFTPFYTTKAQGTGLGLATAKKFVTGHGGTIAVTSPPGAGATFRVTLPAHGEV
jgi:signal transduction histidine kinase